MGSLSCFDPDDDLKFVEPGPLGDLLLLLTLIFLTTSLCPAAVPLQMQPGLYL